MSNYEFRNEELRGLNGKVVLITGGANGIGKAIVDLAYNNGAKVAVCDVDISAGQKLSEQYEGILFQKCDVSKWDDVLAFFHATFLKFGSIDAVISNAAINDVETLESELDVDGSGKLTAPKMTVMDVNSTGTWYVTKCAIHYFKHHHHHNRKTEVNGNSNGSDATATAAATSPSSSRAQLVLFGSVASYFDTPPLYQYCASKGAVLGMMRALRTQLPKINISVNMIAPWMTMTEMATDHIRSVWGDLPANTPHQVARASLMPIVRPELNGLAFLINGGNITEVEAKLDEAQHIWLGPELDKQMREGQRRLIP